jgi:tRNA pseudouridine38-40 synthase
MRIALGIEYDGSAYNGWQKQKHGLGVQEVVEEAISTVANQPIKVVCAGRTDTGVHALEQVVHFDTTAVRDMRSWVFGANANLPGNVSVLWAKQVDDEFHARFSASARCYRYIILNRAVRPAVNAGRVTWEYRPLDVDKMHRAGSSLLGEHDFSSYRALQCQSKTPMRNITRLDVIRDNEKVIIEIEANAFLHHMVRNIAGVLITIGAGDEPVEWSKEVLELRDRAQGGITAPADGLYFFKVSYPERFSVPPSRQELATCFGGQQKS